MDDIDRATRQAARALKAHLANQVGKGQYQGVSRHRCEECDDPIPEGRRQSVQGVRLCTSCQTRLERMSR
ncbi:TraR/DksA family transcriptional regulator [Aeromonas hydrophila]|uniref:TraR/DksA family transcriptional regulator n=1 Tax=Aeromonas hydrophila TaxID=644 RepID=UPI003D1C0560